MAADKIQYEILEDGTIKWITDPISMPNHANADEFLRMAARLAGGETTRSRRTDFHGSHGHSHTHTHTHDGHQH